MSIPASPQQLQFDVLGIRLAAQRWRAGGIPVIALHGWLDNSESFAAIAQYLPSIDLVALDMAGTGHSGHKPASATYLIWDDLREILAVADQLGWQRFGLLGHSRGAIVAALLAAVVPERIRALGLIEGLWAQTCNAEEAPAQMTRSLISEQKHKRSFSQGFASLDEMVRLRLGNGFPLAQESARLLVARNARQRQDGSWCWRTDPRHKLPSMVQLTPEQQQAFHRAIQVPVEMAVASEGLAMAYPDYAERLLHLPHINWALYEGGHHLHMEGAQSILGRAYNQFFQRL